jgi:hypothetical protein
LSNEELVGRMAALEVIAMTALGMHLANARNDPDHHRSGVLLTTMRDSLRTQAETLPTEGPGNIRFAMATTSWMRQRKSIAA